MKKKKSSCCACNGANAKCISCSCVKAGRPCLPHCHPAKNGHCSNLNALPDALSVPSQVESSQGNENTHTTLTSFQSSVSGSSNLYSSVPGACSLNSSTTLPTLRTPPQQLQSSPNETFEDSKIREAFGESLIRNTCIADDIWSKRWQKIVSTKWRHYNLPNGTVAKELIDLLAHEVTQLHSGATRSERLIVFLGLMLHRDEMVKKGQDIRRLLARRIQEWKSEKHAELMQDFERCTKHKLIHHNIKSCEQHTYKVFSNLMLKGQVRSAVRWLTERQSKGGVLDPSSCVDNTQKTVFDILKEKHPEPSQSCPQAFLPSTNLPTLTDLDITSAHIAAAAKRIEGSAGPGGSTATHWQAFLLHYGTHSAKLRDAVAELARRLSNKIVDWKDIRALMSSRLIALDKCPGVRPIAIGEILRRIICRSIVMATRNDIADLCGVDQLCSGIKGGIEGAFHAMKELFEAKRASGWGLLLVDANNAFNSLNRVAAIWNIRIQWPRCARFVFNTYRGYAPLVVQTEHNAEFIFSKEGVAQGDPLSMLMYAAALMPLIQSLSTPNCNQNWYADDSACTADLSHLIEWFEKLRSMGPRYGYYPEPKKTVLIVDKEFDSEAHENKNSKMSWLYGAVKIATVYCLTWFIINHSMVY